MEERGPHHVLAVPRNEELWAGTGLWHVDEVQAVYAHREWQRIGVGAGSKGERWYDWQCRVLAEPEGADWGHYLLFRRPLADPDDWQGHVAFAPRDCELETLVAVAGSRWCIEHAFEAARQETGLDDYEVCSAHGWYRYVTLALLAVVRAADRARPASPKKESGHEQPGGLPPVARPGRGLSLPEIRRLPWHLWLRVPAPARRFWPGRTGGDATSGRRSAATPAASTPNCNCSIGPVRCP